MHAYAHEGIGYVAGMSDGIYRTLEKVLGNDAKTNDVKAVLLEIAPSLDGEIDVFRKLYQQFTERFPDYPISSRIRAAANATFECYFNATTQLSNEVIDESAKEFSSTVAEIGKTVEGVKRSGIKLRKSVDKLE